MATKTDLFIDRLSLKGFPPLIAYPTSPSRETGEDYNNTGVDRVQERRVGAQATESVTTDPTVAEVSAADPRSALAWQI